MRGHIGKKKVTSIGCVAHKEKKKGELEIFITGVKQQKKRKKGEKR